VAIALTLNKLLFENSGEIGQLITNIYNDRPMSKRFYHRTIYFLFTACFFTGTSNAQYKESDFVRYTVKEGLSNNYITCLQQDDLGYLWIGTDIGLNRFDGYSFKNFFQGNSIVSLPSNGIRRLKKFGTDQLGIISNRGFQVLNTKQFSIKNYFVPDSTSFTTYRNAVWDATQLRNNSFAVTTAVGFYVFDRSGRICFRHEAYQPSDVDQKRIFYGRNILQLNNNESIVYVEESGVAYYQQAKNNYQEISTAENELNGFYPRTKTQGGIWVCQSQISPYEFIFIQKDKDSIVYYNHRLKKTVVSPLTFSQQKEISWKSKAVLLTDSSFVINGGYSGFYLFSINRLTGKITGRSEKILPGYKVNCLYLDNDKRLWVGTTSGLLRQKLNTSFLKSYYYSPASNEISLSGFQSGFRYKDKLYLSRYSWYSGLVIIDTATMKVEKSIAFYGHNNPHNEILSIQMYHPDTLWLGSSAGLLWFDTKTYHYGEVLNKNEYPPAFTDGYILEPVRNDGDAWFCNSMNGVVGRYHIATRSFTFYTPETKPSLPFAKTKNIAYDSYGDVWIGGHALSRWNNDQQSFDTLINTYGGINKFNDDIVATAGDAHGSVWMHNADNGLLEYRIKEKRFVPYTMKDGLPSDVLSCFSPVVDDILWIGSANHLTHFNTRTKKCFVYDYHDGYPDEVPRSRKIYYDSAARKFYLFCINHVVVFPQETGTGNGASPAILLQEMSVNNRKTIFHPGDTLRLDYSDKDLSLQFNIIDFESPNAYLFEYKLGNTASWVSLGNQRSINLNQLQSGKFQLQIRATAKSGEQVTKSFFAFIEPPLWQTTWFRIAVALVLAGVIFILVRKRIKSIRREANVNKQLAEYEMKALHAQMNPHFIFNSLNSIKEMILEDQKHPASRYLSKFAQLIRLSLEQSKQTFITLQQNIEHLERYLEMEQLRFADFRYHIDIEEGLDRHEIKIAPMLIQPIVENAIWHGLMNQQEGKELCIRFFEYNDRLVCEIEDNGIGINASLKNKTHSQSIHHSLGIENIRHRIAVLNEKYNIHYGLDIKDKEDIPGAKGTGTRAVISLPVRNNKGVTLNRS
jgi:ligand-binding sensor domain-containing protein